MNTSKRGMSVVALVGGLVVLAVVVLGVLYFASDVFNTKAKGLWNDFSKWTPENIGKDPKGYLNYCEDQVGKAKEKLKASSISIGQSTAVFEGKREDSLKLLADGNKALDEIRVAYLEANAANAWPLKWRGRPFEKEEAKAQVIRLDKDCRREEKKVQAYTQGLDLLKVQDSKVREAQSKADEQLDAIKGSREQLAVKSITDDLKNQLVAMKGVLQTSVLGVAEEKGVMGLEEISAKAQTTVSDQEFSKALGGK